MDRKSHWEKVYTDKSPMEVSWYQKEPELSLQLIDDSRIKKDDPVIDIGGGASTLTRCLNRKGYSHLAVLDISARALDWAQKQLGSEADKVEWIESDVTEFSSSHSYVLWHDRAVFHFLTDAGDRKKYVEVLSRTLVDEGQLIIAAFSIGGPTRCSGLDIVQYDAQKLSQELGNGFQLVDERSELHVTPGETEQQFTYYRFVRV